MAQSTIYYVTGPSKRAVHSSVVSEPGGVYRVEFTPTEVGSHLIEVTVAGEKLPAGPLLAKVYNAALIRVTDVASGVVGQPCQFRVDASQAGEGQLEISINEGEVPNHVTVVGGGRCLVSFTPEHTKPHLIDIKFNGETVTGCPFVCSVSDTSRVSVNLSSLELVPVNQVARFHMAVDSSGSAELAVAITGPSCELPVKVTGNVHSGFTAEFTPREVGPHSISVEYNGHPVSGTPFIAKAYDAKRVYVGPLPQGHVGKPLQFTVDASQAGEGNLEITISAQGVNIPTQVHPQGNAKFAVSFVPIEPVDHVISIYFNKEAVPGSLFIAPVVGDFPLVTGSSLSHAPLGVDSYFTMSNVAGSLDDIEVNVEAFTFTLCFRWAFTETSPLLTSLSYTHILSIFPLSPTHFHWWWTWGPSGQSVPAQVKDAGGQTFKVEFCPRVVGEHKIAVNYRQVAVAGSPFSCKVYDVNAIKVKSVQRGTVGQPVTFLVETSQAGPGNLEVTVNGGRVATSAQAQGPHTYAISFTPRQATTHTVDLRFNGRDVPGSPFSCSVSEAARIVLSGEDKVSVDKPATFVVECEPTVEPPQVQVLSPSRQPVPVTVKPMDGPGRFSCTLTAKDVGDHSVEVKLAGGHVEGSPFLIKAYDATKVKVTDINSGTVGKPVYFSINASQAGAGNLEIIVSVNGCNVPNYVQSEGNAKFRVNFKPREAAPHSLSVRFNGEPIPGSPFTCRVLEPGQVTVSGSGVKMTSAGHPALVHVEGANTCDVSVTSPSNRKLPVKLDRSDNRYIAEFTPVEVGRHLVAVEADNQAVKGSPFPCNVYNVNNIKVTGLGPAKIGKPVTFSVDAMEAGEGTLELVISTQQSTVKAEVVACSRGLYDVTFVPHQLAPHFVNITFNEEDVPGSPYRCEVMQLPSKKATATARGEGLNQVVLGTAAYFEINPHSSDHGTLDAQVIGPDGSRVPCNIEKLETGLYRAKYRPTIVGTHSVTVTQRKQPITKQPFTVQVFDPLQVKLTELSEAFCHRAATFKVDTRGAGSGALSVSIRAAGSEVKHTLRELETPGLYQVVYHPQLAIPHKIHVKYNSMNIAGCPMEVTVSDPAVGRDVCATGLGLYQSRAGRVTHFTIETAGRPAQEFDVVITGPQGSAVPVRCYQQKDGNLMAEFTAASTGVYKIDVLQGSRPVRGSPYHCQVFDATKLKIETLAANSVSVNENISFKLLRKNAGFAELDVTVRSPLGQDLPLSVRSIGEETDLIELCPSLPGNYCFHITYGGDSIPDSPLTFTVVESGVARAWGQGLSRALLDTPARFHVACNGVSAPVKPDVTMEGPGDTSVKCLVTKAPNNGEYEVTYTANKVGVYDIRISCNGKPIAGSPFRAYVVCVDQVRLLADIPGGRLPLSVHLPTRLTFDVAQAGPGDLVAECKAPHNSTLPVPIESPSPDRLQVILTPRAPGPHTLHLSYGGFPLPCSPILALAEGGTGGVRVILTGKGLAGAVCNQQAEFTIDGSQAGPGMPEVSLTGMKNDIKVNLHQVGENVYRATYIPHHPGAYLLNVMWSDRQVKGCPLKVTVTAVCDASRVICSGDGLGIGTVGKDIRSFIDTRTAGPGELSAHCVGPHKVAYCELYDHSDGTFTLNVKPQEAGRHTLTVKYGGKHCKQ
ncbi:hypothetical protein J6590_063971 [Homalodisca vitripennis]|nr:hypothetical protein J6590_063971 [Homalodisca vitripennis]